MVRNAAISTVNIAIHRDAGYLSVALTDSRAVARLARIDVAASRLEQIQLEAAQLLNSQSELRPMSERDAGERARKLGAEIFQQLVPRSIGTFLLKSPARNLLLQVSESLDGIPWELAFDGEHFWGEKFCVARQIILETESLYPALRLSGREFLSVFVLDGTSDAGELSGYCTSLAADLGGVSGLQVTARHISAILNDEVLSRISESDVLHYVGPFAPRTKLPQQGIANAVHAPITVEEILRLAVQPRLLVCERTECGDLNLHGESPLAREACRAGLMLLSKRAPVASPNCDFALALYSGLAQGATIGQATRHAREVSRLPGAPAEAFDLCSVLYGEPSFVVFAKAEWNLHEDSLRQVTVMSYDLVNSTKLLQEVGAESYSELLANYHNQCARIVTRYGGVPNDPQGNDGIMCYFGFPIAHEDMAAHSLRAGLEIVDAVTRLGLGVRVGIATGKVVFRAGQPVGVTIHFAARLQAIARPGTIVVSDATRRIVRDRFGFERIEDAPRLKDFDAPGPLYRLLGAAAPRELGWDAETRLTPFVGRRRELSLLEEQWGAALDAGARTVLVSGDAGIGKSRLVHEFKRSLAVRGQRVLDCRCAPDQASNALFPIIDLLCRSLRINEADTVESKLDRIEAAVVKLNLDGAGALVAALLSIPFEPRLPPLASSAEKQRQLTLDVLSRWIKCEAERAPICLIVEDVHWMDPSSQEFLSQLVAATERLPLLLVITRRPTDQPRWNVGGAVHELELNRLSPDLAREMVVAACAGVRLSNELVRFLAARADGVPLFIEESTRMAVELGVASGPQECAAAALRLAVPDSIHDLLMARLDRLAAGKAVAQLGAAIGREFPLELLEAVLAHETAPLQVSDLAAQLHVLSDSGLVIKKGDAAHVSYVFKHALVRDAAYQSMLERDRKRLHRAIATVIREKFQNLAESRPELLAYHYTEAAIDAEAVAYWERAARRAGTQSANDEAISHLTTGLAAVARLPAGRERDQTELRLLLLLAAQLIATEGYGADRVEHIYGRALALCQAAGDDKSMMKVLLGLEGFHFMRADFAKAHTFAARAAVMAAASDDPVRRLQSTWAIANILFHQGEVATAVAHMDACLDDYQHTQIRRGGVQDPAVMCLCYSAWAQWELGYPDDALRRAHRVVEFSATLNHPFSLGEAYGFLTAVQHFRGENEDALHSAERAIEICEEHGFAVWLAHAKLMRGRIMAALGEVEEGIEHMRHAFEMWSATGAVVTQPFYLALQAEGLALAGRAAEGLAVLDQAFAIVRACGERYYEPEIRRLIGALTLQAGAQPGGSGAAEEWFRSGLAVAATTKLRSLGLRCATSLARLLFAQGRNGEALAALQPSLGWFAEGRDTRDLQQAHGLLHELLDASPISQ